MTESMISMEAHCYSHSEVVQGYLNNKSRRFSKDMEQIIAIIYNTMEDSKWHYVSSEENPADLATRPTTPRQLLDSMWTK